jgi:NADPH2:quinone reductase
LRRNHAFAHQGLSAKETTFSWSREMSLQLRSLVTREGELELSLADVESAEPADDEVTIRVDATPLNPSDLGLLFGGADPASFTAAGTPSRPVIKGRVPDAVLKTMTARLGQSLTVGNEGAGVVVRAGKAPAAQALVGKTVAVMGGGMYAQLRTVKISSCLPLPEGTKPAEGAACFVNPLTALGMVETMRREGHTALVHTAAASNLGQMLNRVCIQDGVKLVNIVRKQDQEDLLRAQGATYVCNSSAPTFIADLRKAVAETGATLAFDAIGGGRQAGQILSAMEAAAAAKLSEYSRYGSSTHKQVYVYGSLDRGPTEIVRDFGLSWGIGGWLLMPFLQKAGPATLQKLRERIVADLKTTFASLYNREISLAEALQLDNIAVYGKMGTAGKFLINPSK